MMRCPDIFYLEKYFKKGQCTRGVTVLFASKIKMLSW